MAIEKVSATGSAAIAATTSALPNAQYRVKHVTLHLSAAPTTSGNFTITLDAKAGAAYDTLLYSVDLSVGGITNLAWFPDGDFMLAVDDEIDVAYANADGRTYGVQITLEKI